MSRKPQQPNVILGVLEDIPGEYAGDTDFRAVRAVFEKNGDRWSAFPTSAKSERDLQSLQNHTQKRLHGRLHLTARMWAR